MRNRQSVGVSTWFLPNSLCVLSRCFTSFHFISQLLPFIYFFFSSVTVLSVLPYYSQPTLQSPLLLQLQVQQQAALMASVGQGGYLSPMAAFAAAQMQHMATINGLPGAPLTPTSGNSGLWSEVKGLWWLVPSTTEMAFRTVFTFTNFFWSKS